MFSVLIFKDSRYPNICRYANCVVFTFSKSLLATSLTAFYSPFIILVYYILHFGVTIGLFGYSYFTTKDFRSSYGFMFGSLICSIIFALLMGLFGNIYPIQIFVCYLLSNIFAIYIVFEIQLIANEKYELSSEQYACAVTLAYLDVILLPISYLRFLCKKNN